MNIIQWETQSPFIETDMGRHWKMTKTSRRVVKWIKSLWEATNVDPKSPLHSYNSEPVAQRTLYSNLSWRKWPTKFKQTSIDSRSIKGIALLLISEKNWLIATTLFNLSQETSNREGRTTLFSPPAQMETGPWSIT